MICLGPDKTEIIFMIFFGIKYCSNDISGSLEAILIKISGKSNGRTTGDLTYCSGGPSNILTHDLPRSFLSSDRICRSNQIFFSVLSHMTVISFLFASLPSINPIQ